MVNDKNEKRQCVVCVLVAIVAPRASAETLAVGAVAAGLAIERVSEFHKHACPGHAARIEAQMSDALEAARTNGGAS